MIDFKIKELERYYDPFFVYKLFKNNKDTIFLDSSKEDKNLSKYSFIGLNPYKKFVSNGNQVKIDEEIYYDVDPFDELEKLIKDNKFEFESNIPLISGAIGFFSYDIARTLEELPNTAIEYINVPDSIFIFFDNIIIFDLQNKKTYITACGQLKESEASILEVENKLTDYKVEKEVIVGESKNQFYSNFQKRYYEGAVENLRNYIRNGDVYIANMTRQVWCENDEESFSIYERLRSINKAPFSSFMNFDEFQVISSSPERFIEVYKGKAITRPIKGTRPRGKDKLEDDFNREALMNSEKDKSELLMVVDLERNDLSKVCKPSTVKVTELFKIEEYATVFHLVSTIEGELKEGVTAVKCMKECYPGGSITGTPKIRAMELIEELEGVKRGLYTGSIGYFDFRGNSDFNIVIRTIIKKDNKAYFGVGGGVTWESNSTDEWFETIDKAKALMRVL